MEAMHRLPQLHLPLADDLTSCISRFFLKTSSEYVVWESINSWN